MTTGPGQVAEPRPGLPPGVDRVVALVGLAALSPVLLVAAVAIKLDSPGPVLFRHERVGRRGRPFVLLKLRTFAHNSPREGVWTPLDEATDPRITRIGRLLRRTSLDEVPNLANVVRGEMALVGPRPTIAEQVAEYTPAQRRRLDVRPGLTGWAQVNGGTGISWADRIELDIWYVDHRSAALDLRILLRTIRVTLAGKASPTGR